MHDTYVISATTENQMRVLQRMAGIFARFRVNIEQLSVAETSTKGISAFRIVILSDAKTVEKVTNQLQRIIELLDVKVSSKVAVEEFSKVN